MSRLSKQVCRADLVRMLRQLDDNDTSPLAANQHSTALQQSIELLDKAATSLGFSYSPPKPEKSKKNNRPKDRLADGAAPLSGDDKSDSLKPDLGIALTPKQRPEMIFYGVTEFQPASTPQLVQRSAARTDTRIAELPLELEPLPYQPLSTWPSIWPFLHDLLSYDHVSQQVDIKALQKKLSQLKPIEAIPKKINKRWSPQAQMWLDLSERIAPFHRDMWFLNENILRQRGASGLQTWLIKHHPYDGFTRYDQGLQEQLAEPEAYQNGPLLICSDLGCYDTSGRTAQVWLNFGGHLKQQKCRPYVLMPCPDKFWHSGLDEFYQLIYWDRNTKFSNPGQYSQARAGINFKDSRTATKVNQQLARMATILLGRTASAIRVEHQLLRAIRLQSGDLNAGHEAAAWNSNDVFRTALGFGFRADGESQRAQQPLKQPYEEQFATLPEEQKEAIRLLIARCHKALSDDIHFEETFIYKALVGADTAQERAQFLEASDEGSSSESTSHWLERVLFRVPGQMRQTENDWYSQFTQIIRDDSKNRQQTLPSGVSFQEFIRKRHPDVVPQTYLLIQENDQLSLHLEPTHTPPPEWQRIANVALRAGWFQLYSRQFNNRQLTEDNVEGFIQSKPDRLSFHELIDGQLPLPGLPLFRHAYSAPAKRDNQLVDSRSQIILQTEAGDLSLEPIAKPPWASAMGRDQYGLFADLNLDAVTQRFRWINPGKFLMGSPIDEQQRLERETAHWVSLTQGYWLADTACTQALWQAVLPQSYRTAHFQGDRRPMERISWDDSQQFIEQLNRRSAQPDSTTGEAQFRLPTEAEWEYACRAGTTTPFSFGENITTEEVNYHGNYPSANGPQGEYREATMAVKSLPENPWGLFEMHGNVLEWCQDWFDDYPQQGVVNPIGPKEGSSRVIRGGSWLHLGCNCRSASRYCKEPDGRDADVGLRLAWGPILQDQFKPSIRQGKESPAFTTAVAEQAVENAGRVEGIKKKVGRAYKRSRKRK